MSNRFVNNAPIKTRGELRLSSTPLPQYACLHCRMDLYTSENLKEHAYTADHFLQCGCCNDLLSTPEAIAIHLTYFSHEMKCGQCNEMFATYQKWRNHMFRTGHRVWFDLANLQRVGPYGALSDLLPKDGNAIRELVDRLEMEKRRIAKEKAEYNIFADNEILDPIELSKKLMKRAIQIEGLFNGMDQMEIDSERSEDDSITTSRDSSSQSEEDEMEYQADDEKDRQREEIYSYIYMEDSGKEIKIYTKPEKPFITVTAEHIQFTTMYLNKPLVVSRHARTAADFLNKSSYVPLINRRRARLVAADFFEGSKRGDKEGVRKRVRARVEWRRRIETTRPGERQSRKWNQYKQYWA